MAWAQLVAGPPGSGKTTYCRAMLEVCRASGRDAAIINLDPANDRLPYTAAVDIMELIAVSDVMEAYELGPNGGLQYAMEFLEANVDWLEQKLQPLVAAHTYMLFDTPGQAELYATHDSLARVLEHIARRLDIRFVAIHLVDSHHCTDPYKFIAAATLSLQAMLRLALPHLNVLSKVDLAHNFLGEHAEYGLESFTDMLDLTRILPAVEDETEDGADGHDHDGHGYGGPHGSATGASAGASTDKTGLNGAADSEDYSDMPAGEMVPTEDAEESRVMRSIGVGQRDAVEAAKAQQAAESPVRKRERARRRAFAKRFHSLNERLVEVVQDFSLISFQPITVTDSASLVALLQAADKAGGYVPLKEHAGKG